MTNTPAADAHTCQRCGSDLRRGQTETAARFRTRKYCSTGCAQKARRKPDTPTPASPPSTSCSWRLVGDVYRPPGFADQPNTQPTTRSAA
jgi:hypothetical protein